MSTMSEKEIVMALAQSKPDAFEQMFKSYFQVLTVFAKKFVYDLEVAEDMVQEVFIKVYEKQSTLHLHGSLKSFLFQSVRNRCLDHLRSQSTREKHKNEIAREIETIEGDPSMYVEQTELEERVFRAIEDLPDQCKLIFKMNRLEGKKNQEIADELNISKRTVETQISKALKKLRLDMSDVISVAFILVLYFFEKFE